MSTSILVYLSLFLQGDAIYHFFFLAILVLHMTEFLSFQAILALYMMEFPICEPAVFGVQILLVFFTF